ncbi:amidohydrolase family protein [Fodinibius halophilus]|uniref:Amidohydrolase family protein n=1 Tax=Fodinibius halophilus TaxID=1736908 RepID=A0A6M1T5M2_9BACT|nr:amidohydrolase family protein [Fodinibius halophilus]NGP89397.1 amidohydrolase family protein [Fodinibius halophilus]
MRKYILAAVALFCLFSLSSLVYAQSGPTFIKGGQYFDVETQQMVDNDGILVRGGRFYEIGDVPSQNNEAEYEVIRLEEDEYILPGIVDVHAHFRMDAFGSEEGKEIDEFKYNSLVYLVNGVTSAFANGVYYPHMELAAKRLINSGKWTGPRIWASGPYFGRARPDWEDYSKEEIYEQVDHWVSLGVDGFKTKGGDPQTVKHLVNRAHHHGLTVAGHLGSGYKGTTNAITAIDAGIDRVEHILGGFVLEPDRYAYPVWNKVDTTSKDFKKTVQYYLDHNVYFDATINAPVYFTTLKEGFDYWKDEKGMFTSYVRSILTLRKDQEGNELMDGLYKAMRRSTKAFYDAGGGDLITLGTDAPTHGYFLAGFGAHREMHTMVMAGIPEKAVLKIASQNGANALGKGSLLGSIETGKMADLYVVQGNPLKDITNTRDVQLVMKSGQVYDPQKLLEQVKGKIGPESKSEIDDWFKYPALMEEVTQTNGQ